ncbi:uncharacterized protein LOC126484669 [Schistocerca serialis cubense]|uniref:uncharacterized protein LOC126484669 n=1 Tax=Schistocerca serialis cubense TaxID=2023355 RepID=UPI00214EF3E6|nr:uncharacterized protein LOC126484669 [Schistocerca serialis cubense]
MQQCTLLSPVRLEGLRTAKMEGKKRVWIKKEETNDISSAAASVFPQDPLSVHNPCLDKKEEPELHLDMDDSEHHYLEDPSVISRSTESIKEDPSLSLEAEETENSTDTHLKQFELDQLEGAMKLEEGVVVETPPPQQKHPLLSMLLLQPSPTRHQPTPLGSFGMSSTHKRQKFVNVGLGALLDAVEGAVITLVAGETQLVVHRAVLVARSPVFEAMFRHETLETSRGRVVIPDVEGPVLRQLVVYLYTLQVPQSASTAPELLAAADKYGISGLKAACEQRVAAQVTVDNAAATAVLALRHSCPTLTEATVTFIKSYSDQVMATEDWMKAVHHHPDAVLELINLLADDSISRRRNIHISMGAAAKTFLLMALVVTAASATDMRPDFCPENPCSAVFCGLGVRCVTVTTQQDGRLGCKARCLDAATPQ